jgi:DNA methylase
VSSCEIIIHHGDCLKILPALTDGSADCCVTDPPYGLEFMGKEWDQGVPGVRFWQAILRVLKPGGYLLSFGGTRTYHRLTCAIEDAGFEVRDCILWLFGSGYPKGQGCLKPAYEPCVLARRPGAKVLPLGLDECRVPTTDNDKAVINSKHAGMDIEGYQRRPGTSLNLSLNPIPLVAAKAHPAGRYPANVVHDGSDEVLEAFAAFGERRSRASERDTRPTNAKGNCYGLKDYANHHRSGVHFEDAGTAARFFYCAKASRSERNAGCEELPQRMKLRDDLTPVQCAYVLEELRKAGVAV